jgi:hypothetical protein
MLSRHRWIVKRKARRPRGQREDEAQVERAQSDDELFEKTGATSSISMTVAQRNSATASRVA